MYKYGEISKSKAIERYIISLKQYTCLYIKECLPIIFDHAILLVKTMTLRDTLPIIHGTIPEENENVMEVRREIEMKILVLI